MKTTPPRSEGSNPSLSATTLKPDLRDQRDQTELEQWKQGLIQPIIRLMAKRGIVELHITRKAGTNGTFQFELVPDQDTQDAPVFEVGAHYIFPMDRPSGYWCCVVTHESGIAHYLNIHGKRWPHALNLTKLGRGKAVPLATYGVEVSKDATGLVFEQKQHLARFTMMANLSAGSLSIQGHASGCCSCRGNPRACGWIPKFCPSCWLGSTKTPTNLPNECQTSQRIRTAPRVR